MKPEKIWWWATRAYQKRIPLLPQLLKLLNITGCVVTTDAMGCQKSLAEQVKKQGGEYVLALKDNHALLHNAVRHLLGRARTPEGQGRDDLAVTFCQTRSVGHGRQETRRCFATSSLDWSEAVSPVDEPSQWPGLKSVALVECERRVGTGASQTTSVESRCFVSSLPATKVKQILRSVRCHWHIENKLHWVLDVAFAEDDCRVRVGNAPQNLAALRHLALNLLRQDQSDAVGVKARRLRAGWDNEYLLAVLAGAGKAAASE